MPLTESILSTPKLGSQKDWGDTEAVTAGKVAPKGLLHGEPSAWRESRRLQNTRGTVQILVSPEENYFLDPLLLPLKQFCNFR